MIKNVKVYGLYESMVASGYPMLEEELTEKEFTYEVENLKYWLDNGLKDINIVLNRNKGVKEYHRRIPNDILLEDDYAVVVTRNNAGEVTGKFKIDVEDILLVAPYKFCASKGRNTIYANAGDLSLHRLITGVTDNSLVVDHIDGDGTNNRRANLRICSTLENSRNNSGKGISFRKDRNKWRAYINVNGKQISLGSYSTEAEANQARAQGELKYFGDFSKSIKSVIDFDNNTYSLSKAIRHYRRCINLGNVAGGTGHDNFAKGVRVQFDLTATHVFMLQFMRYHFQDIISLKWAC